MNWHLQDFRQGTSVLRCIAAGIYDDTGKVVAGLSISAPSGRLQDAWIPQLVATAGTISEALGYETGATAT